MKVAVELFPYFVVFVSLGGLPIVLFIHILPASRPSYNITIGLPS